MQGLELAKAYYEEYGRAMIESGFSQYKKYIAVGLVGEGSECYGYDDEFSQDHDFGPGFCIWLPTEVFESIGPRMRQAYDSLPKSCRGFDRSKDTATGTGRAGVFSIERFYHKYTNCGAYPKDNLEWFRIPERFLSVATNGQVFCDYQGDFTKAREILKGFYPEDVLRKKLAARAAIMAQAGQYNYPRSTRRGDFRAAYLTCGEFVKAAVSAVYLLNRVYMPFYKWAFRGMEELTTLPAAIGDIKELVLLCDEPENTPRKQWLIENICVEVGKELNRKGLSQINDPFLQNHCESIMGGITDSRLRKLHVMADVD